MTEVCDHVHTALDPTVDGNAVLVEKVDVTHRREICACGAYRVVHRYTGETIGWRRFGETLPRGRDTS